MIILEVLYGTQAVSAVYKGTELIWDHGCSIKAVMAVDADMEGRVVSIRIVPVTGSAFADAGADALAEFIPGMPLSGSGAVTAGVDGTAHRNRFPRLQTRRTTVGRTGSAS